jgi:hypothetical protein
MGLAKAQYAVGYFTEVRHVKWILVCCRPTLTRALPAQVGIGTPASPPNAIQWYRMAADNGDKRADKRLKNFGSAAVNAANPANRNELLARATEGGADGKGSKDKDCVIM